jgi:hypothetical protein
MLLDVAVGLEEPGIRVVCDFRRAPLASRLLTSQALPFWGADQAPILVGMSVLTRSTAGGCPEPRKTSRQLSS